jgi:hypothetical protein
VPSLVALAGLAFVTALSVPGAAAATSGCTKVASPTGSDTAAGTEAAPYRTLQKLVSSLSSGDVACLRAGTYTGSDTYLKAADVTLQSYPGETATIGAFFEVYPSAARSRVQGLRFDGSLHGNNTGVKVQADDAVFAGNEVTKGGQGICMIVGSWNSAQRVTVERNRIYNCGPAGTKYDHQIYLPHARNAVVRWNLLYGNGGGWGVHLYPDADGTLVEHNVIDGNTGGVIFAGDGSGATSDNNVVRNNAITYSSPRWNAEGSWSGGPAGSGNTVRDNCVYTTGPDSPSGIAAQSGFSAFSNTVLSGSPYVDRGARDYRFSSGSPCAALVGDVAGAVAGGSPAVASAAPEDKALRKAATASSAAKPSRSPGRANDGDSSTRWASARGENQWWQVDLGRARQVDKLSLSWYSSYASRYRVLTSTDGVNFSQVADVTISSPGRKDTAFAAVSARYIRVLGLTRVGKDGISLFDAQVFGPAD